MSPTSRLLPDGQRLHLQHGPSDLIVWAEGARDVAYRAASMRFETILAEVVDELADLQTDFAPQTEIPKGAVAKRMHAACLPFAGTEYLTRMASVAGAIADEVLSAMTGAANITRAYVNNGGDIALHLTLGTTFRTAICGHDGANLSRIEIRAEDGIGGIATSGRHGRSLSRGIADGVTILAENASKADVAATLIANAVDVPGHPAILRRAANEVREESDLGDLPVVVGCGRLSFEECAQALSRGRTRADAERARGLIVGAGLFLQDQAVTSGEHLKFLEGELTYDPA